METPTCPTCQRGRMVLCKKHRMSSPVVVIGWLLLVPSFLGMIFAVLMFVGTVFAATQDSTLTDKRIRESLLTAGVSGEMADRVIAMTPIQPSELSVLSEKQSQAVRQAQSEVTAQMVGRTGGAVVAGGITIFMFFAAMVGGLLGWLLVMKKKVLQCTNCSAVIPAS